MSTAALRLGPLLLLGLLAAGCDKSFPFVANLETEKRYLGHDSVVVTGAEHRALVNVKVPEKLQKPGEVTPTRIICAEPSPDVAKALQTAFGASLSASAPEAGSGAGALSAATAESVAQLGERLATIQLLRDGLYRACEAYANGAISSVEYTVMLSRFDDTMVTMLLGELAAGAFGRSLAGIGGSAESSATGEAEGLLEASRKFDSLSESSEKTRTEKEAEVAEARERSNEANALATEDPSEENKAAATIAEADLVKKEKELQEVSDMQKAAAQAAATAKAAATVTVGGGIDHKPTKEVAEQIALMQKKFIENINADALVIACIHALSNPRSANTQMASACRGEGGQGGYLDKIMASQAMTLDSVKGRNIAKRDAKAFREALEQLKAMFGELKDLKSAVDAN